MFIFVCVLPSDLYMHARSETTYKSRFSPSTVCAQGIELKALDVIARPFPTKPSQSRSYWKL